MKISIVSIALFAAGFLAAPAALAQLDGSRCGGWPGAQGVPGIIVGHPGATCNGNLFGRPPSGFVFRSARVARAPAHGRFDLTGARTFAYTAPTTFHRDIVVLDVEWEIDGRITHRPKAFQIMTAEAYSAAGGTESGPGDIGVTSRRTPRRGGAGFRN